MGHVADDTRVTTTARRGFGQTTAHVAVGARLGRIAFVGAVTVSLIALLPVTIGALRTIRADSHLSKTEIEVQAMIRADIDPNAFAQVERIIPPKSTYYITVSRSLSRVSRLSFIAWANGTLLPRLAVANPTGADWIVSWGRIPRLQGAIVKTPQRLAHSPQGVPVFVGRVVRIQK